MPKKDTAAKTTKSGASKKKTAAKRTKTTTTKKTAAGGTRAKRSTKATAASQIEAKITHEQIARRAYEIWIARGRPEGLDRAHWYQAERELAAPTRR